MHHYKHMIKHFNEDPKVNLILNKLNKLRKKE